MKPFHMCSKLVICIGLLVVYFWLLLIWKGLETEHVTQPPPLPSYNISIYSTDVDRTKTGLDFAVKYTFSQEKRPPQERKKAYYSSPEVQDVGPDCNTNIMLKQFTHEQSVEDQIFFIETSGRSHLTPRQACAVESAAKESRLKVNVLLISPILSLKYNVSCRVHRIPSIYFYHVNATSLLEGTPLEELERSGRLSASKWRMTHYSDALRLAVLYKFGGFYSDLDSVTIRDLRRFKNVVGSTSRNGDPSTLRHVANGELQLHHGHRLLLYNMKKFAEVFLGEYRVEVGPMLTTRSIKELYGVDDVYSLKASDLTVLEPSAFFPARSYETGKLWTATPKSFLQWKEFFSNSSMVHFYGSLTNKWKVDGSLAHEAYALLAPRYCPVSYESTNDF